MPTLDKCSFVVYPDAWEPPTESIHYLLRHEPASGNVSLGVMQSRPVPVWGEALTAHRAAEGVLNALKLPLAHLRVLWKWDDDQDIRIALFAWIPPSPSSWYPKPNDMPLWLESALRNKAMPLADHPSAWDRLMGDE